MRGATFGASGLPSAAFTVASDAFFKTNPSLASGLGGFAAAWTGFDGSQDTLFVQRLDPVGAAIGALETVATASGLRPHIACDGAQWFVAWVNDSTGIYEGPLMVRRLNAVTGF